MAALRRLLSQNAHRCFSNPPPSRHLVSLIRRHFSTEPQPSPTPESSAEPNEDFRRPIPIQPVSYAAKPKPPPPEETPREYPPDRQTSSQDTSNHATPEARSWTRDEMRYIKDAPVIAPVSYTSRVAPLPEDRVTVVEDLQKELMNEELERERRRMQRDMRMERSRYGRVEVEEESLPFPKVIKVEGTDENSKKKEKVVYDLKEAIRFAKANGKKIFDETLEAHVKMTPELRRTDLKLNASMRLPHGFGKTYRVAVFAEGAAADEAREAGADIVGGSDLVASIRSGEVKVDFDKCIATPSMMDLVKKIAQKLKQLMPHARNGTLTNEISKAVKEAKVESINFKKDKTAIVHVGLGKLSFPEDNLRENVGTFVNALLLAKPAGLKKSSKFAGYIDSFHISSTMGRSYPITILSLSMAADHVNKMNVQRETRST
ncbi:hypothetical protein ACS0TY_017584 [Phlomoides rotata]